MIPSDRKQLQLWLGGYLVGLVAGFLAGWAAFT